MSFTHQQDPFIVPTTDGKLIQEHFGRVATGMEGVSVARMVAPPGWSEPHQTPGFDEFTLVSRGRKLIEVDGQEVVVSAGESILVKRGSRVRYANPYPEECEYWSVCLPAFSLDTVNREEG